MSCLVQTSRGTRSGVNDGYNGEYHSKMSEEVAVPESDTEVVPEVSGGSGESIYRIRSLLLLNGHPRHCFVVDQAETLNLPLTVDC